MKNLVVGHLIACFYINIYTALDIWQSSSVPRPLPDPVFVFFFGTHLERRAERQRRTNENWQCFIFLPSGRILFLALRKMHKMYFKQGIFRDRITENR